MNTAQCSLPLATYSLKDLQQFNRTVYGTVNGRNFDLADMVCRVSRYNARVSLRIREENTDRTPYHLSMMFSWLLAIGNRLGVEVNEEVAIFCRVSIPFTASLAELQKAFVVRHDGTTLEKAGLCLAEKVQGLASALEYYRETHEKAHFLEAEKLVAQIIEALCVVAHLLGVSLAEAFETNFKCGCHTCLSVPCDCGFRANKVM